MVNTNNAFLFKQVHDTVIIATYLITNPLIHATKSLVIKYFHYQMREYFPLPIPFLNLSIVSVKRGRGGGVEIVNTNAREKTLTFLFKDLLPFSSTNTNIKQFAILKLRICTHLDISNYNTGVFIANYFVVKIHIPIEMCIETV